MMIWNYEIWEDDVSNDDLLENYYVKTESPETTSRWYMWYNSEEQTGTEGEMWFRGKRNDADLYMEPNF